MDEWSVTEDVIDFDMLTLIFDIARLFAILFVIGVLFGLGAGIGFVAGLFW